MPVALCVHDPCCTTRAAACFPSFDAPSSASLRALVRSRRTTALVYVSCLAAVLPFPSCFAVVFVSVKREKGTKIHLNGLPACLLDSLTASPLLLPDC